MGKMSFDREYEVLRARMVEMRHAARITQRELALRMRRERSFVSRIEMGERRLDMVEFYRVCRACGQDPGAVARNLMRAFRKTDRRKR